MNPTPKKARDKIKKTALPETGSFYPGISNVVSATDTTGLMYRPPENQDECDFYGQLSNMEVPKSSRQ